jgi:hypothetical protein
VTPQDALTDVEIAFRQLEFSIKLLTFCELGSINPADFDTDHIIELGNERLHFPSGKFGDQASLERAAGTSVLTAMSASVLVLDDAFAAFGVPRDPTAVDNKGQLRALIYMVRCAYAHGIAAPVWEVRNHFLRTFSLSLVGFSFSVDLRAMDGQPFDVEQIGGYANWCRMRDEALRVLK